MPNIFDELDAILAIKRSQWKDYAKQWRGKEVAPDTQAYVEARDKFKRDYLAANPTTVTDETFLPKFKNLLKADRKLKQTCDKSILENWSEIVSNISEQENIDIAFFDRIRDDKAKKYFIYKSDFIQYIPIYKQKKQEYQSELKDQILANLDTELELWSQENSDSYSIQTAKYNVSEVYKQLFESLKPDNPLNTKYRVYFPIEITSADIAASKTKNTNSKVSLGALDWALAELIEEYFTIKNKDEEIDPLNTLALKNPTIFRTNYLDGYYISPVTNRKERIGKIFQFVKAKNPSFSYYGMPIEQIEKVFIDRPVGFKGLVCISRHPHDIAAMSTDRGWTSCMDLNKHGQFTRFIGPTIMNAGLIAYLIKEGDTKIDNPTSRLLLKSYTKQGETLNYEEPNWVLVVSNTYGTIYSKFTKAVQDWANRVWNYKVEKSKDKYSFNKNFYFENEDRESLKAKDLFVHDD